MRRDVSVSQFDRLVNKMIASAAICVLFLSSLAFVVLFFYKDINMNFANFKQSFRGPQPVFDSSVVESVKSTIKNDATIPRSQNEQREADKIFVAYELGDTALASKLITDFIVDFPESQLQNAVRIVGAKIMSDKSDFSGAMNYIQKILASENISNKDYTEAVLLLGEIARERKQHDSYIQSFLEQAFFKAQEPTKSKLSFYLGYLFLNKGEHSTALTYFNNVIGEDGVLGRAEVYEAQLMAPESINSLEHFLEQYPTSKNYDYARTKFLDQVFSYSKSLTARGYFENAERSLKKITKLFPTSADGDKARFEIAKLHHEKKEFERATKLLVAIIENTDSTYNADALFMLGQISFEKNDQEQALTYFRTIIEDYPNHKLVGKSKQWLDLISQSLRH
ncbi:MAG: tetratricopeptide repeat protein [Brevinema sp.]